METYLSQLTLLEQLVPILVPLAVAGIKRVAIHLPKWAIPAVIVPALGVMGQAFASAATGADIDPILGVVLGGIGLFVREVADQIKAPVREIRDGEPAPRVGAAKR